ncbi:MAG: hypothetical protein R3F14_15755 [Polyangiaceae bacterium]
MPHAASAGTTASTVIAGSGASWRREASGAGEALSHRRGHYLPAGAPTPCAGPARLAHRDEFLGGGGVDADGGVELLLGGAALQGDGEALRDLGASAPTMWTPSTRRLARATTSFIMVRSSRPVMVCLSWRSW